MSEPPARGDQIMPRRKNITILRPVTTLLSPGTMLSARHGRDGAARG